MKKVEKLISSRRKLHFTLIDPAKRAVDAEKIRMLESYGTDAIMLGGSTDVKQNDLDKTIFLIKKNSRLPIILFPGGLSGLSSHADALFFMSLLNSRDPYWIAGIQAHGVHTVRKLGIETIPMAYLIIEPGMKAGEVGKAVPIRQNDSNLAVAYALAAQHMGFRVVYLEAGSGANKPVPPKMITAVKKSIDVPLIVGGGIRKPVQARAAMKAGANVVVTGTIGEENFSALEKIIRAVKR